MATIALPELMSVKLPASVVATLQAHKAVGQSPATQHVEALVFRFIDREELVKADSLLKLHWGTVHLYLFFQIT